MPRGKNMDSQEEDDFAKMFYVNISDYLRNVHKLEVKDVSQRGMGTYQLLVDFEDQVISIQVARDKNTELAREVSDQNETENT